MRIYSTILTTLCVLAFQALSAQMWNGSDTLYGNEWIRYGRPYYKILVADDGIYRIPYASLAGQGIPMTSVAGAQFQLFRLGEEVPLYTTATGIFGAGDFIEFYGARNRGELDRYLYRNPDTEMLNPFYSIVTDTSAYFLTWVEPGAPTLRYQTISNDLNTPPPKEEWFWYELQQVFVNTVVQKTDNEGLAESRFDEGEGFSRDFLSSLPINFTPKFVYPAAISSRYRLRMFSNNRPHDLRITVGGTTFYTETFNGFRLQNINFEKPTANLAGTEQVAFTGAASSNDRHALAWASLIYPRAFNFENQNAFAFQMPESGQVKYLEINNFNAGGTPPVLYNLTDRSRLTAELTGTTVRLLLPPSASQRELFLVNPNSGVKTVTTLRPVTFTDYRNADAEYIIISHPRLYDDGNGGNPVQEYADYRASEAGGSYRSIVLNVEELYDQFAYGVHRHPLAIRNAAHLFVRQWSEPKYVLLIGKGRQYGDGRTAAQVAGTFYVPTFGVPGSDNLLLASNHSNVPILPIGRIAAATPAEVRQYLDKVIAHEQSSRSPEEKDRDWKKEVIHLGGGNGASEQQFIKNAMAQLGNTLRNSSIGANVLSLFKTNNDPIQQVNSEALMRRINDGASIMTVYGHASENSFDVAVDEPSTYRNEGRYPAVFSLGCYSGLIHSAARSIGERFIFQDRKGALAFLATTGLGGLSVLNTYGQAYFNHLGNSLYGRGIGDVLRLTIQQFDQTGNFQLRALLQQYTLHGDPALVITPPSAPDFVLRTAEAAVTPRAVDAQADSVELSFVMRNIGKALPDSINMEIIRRFPNGTELTSLRLRVPAPRYMTRYQLRLPLFGNQSVGVNSFRINTDVDNEVAEAPLPMAEQNNALADAQGREGIEFVVFANGAMPLYPPDMGIVGNAPVILNASTMEVFALEQRYIFELDTTLLFDSPALQRHTLTQTGGLLQWSPPLPWRDSTVYYWRISPDSLPGQGYNWRHSSFLYLNGSPGGWNQSHYYQWNGNRFISMEVGETTRQLKFLDDAKFVRVTNGLRPGTLPGVNINNDPHPFVVWDSPVDRGIYIFSLDAETGIPWINNRGVRVDGNYGLYGSSQRTGWAYYGHFPYWTNSMEWRERAINFLQNVIPSGNYVVLYTVQNAGDTLGYAPRAWAADSLQLGANLFQVLEAQGAQLIRSTADTGPRPYILMYKKDDPSWPVVEILGDLNESILATAFINGLWDRGEVYSPRIGPSNNWASLHWQRTSTDSTDIWSLNLYGIRPDSVEVLLLPDITVADTSLVHISAAEYPYLRLGFRAADTLQRTSPHIPYWRVLYEGLPDAVLNPAAAFRFHKDTLQQGEPLSLDVAVSNITSVAIDSFWVRFTIADPAGNRQVFQRRLPPLPPNDTLMASLLADTRSLSGIQQIRIEVNPERERPEMHYFNNNGIREFYVEQDRRNPLLEVAFDGQRIMDGDIVSAKPIITIALRDENRWLRLQDTSLFKVLIRYPNASDVTPVPLGAEYVRFIPAGIASGADNRAVLELTPHFSQSGTYTLTVQGRDVTGNSSGELDYRVNFEVITEARISNVLNYPNPFTTSTRFVYTLTGEEAPAFFVIRIMTVSGRIVHELTQDHLGPLRIGTHQTDYAWDGTDMYGDRLANGVYLYQVIAKDREGKDLIKYDTDTDGFFRNGIGKLVLLR